MPERGPGDVYLDCCIARCGPADLVLLCHQPFHNDADTETNDHFRFLSSSGCVSLQLILIAQGAALPALSAASHHTQILTCGQLNYIVASMLPDFNKSGTLPPGIHFATMDEVWERFGFNARRRQLLEGLSAALTVLQAAGCRTFWLDGSFVTNKEYPGDFDGCWDAAGVDPNVLDPVLLDFSNSRARQKAKYGGEMFVAGARATPAGQAFIDFFQTDRNGHAKGVVAIELRRPS